jgi:RNA polymerase sigma factor (sigma-70 family)
VPLVSSAGSVTHWIDLAKAGDQRAVEELHRRYFARMVGLARKKLGSARRRVADEEDVAQRAFASFWQGAVGGRFPKLRDRNDLLALLVVITCRRAIDLLQLERRRPVAGESALSGSANSPAGIAQTPDRPAPDLDVEAEELFRSLFDRLGDDRLRMVARCRFEGYTNAEIAAKLGCSVRTVEQKLRAIRAIWGEEDRS